MRRRDDDHIHAEGVQFPSLRILQTALLLEGQCLQAGLQGDADLPVSLLHTQHRLQVCATGIPEKVRSGCITCS